MTSPVSTSAQVPPAPVRSGDAMLEVRNLTRRFGGLVAVNNVSFAVKPGEIFGLIGPNGAGKTTTFNMITSLTPPSSGTIAYKGKDITFAPPHRIARMGVARTFQNIRLFGNLTALENVMIAQHVHTHSGLFGGVLGLPRARREEKHIRVRSLELLGMVGLADRAEEKARNFPYGDQRRLEIARALALEPKMLLLDEPAAGMNPREKQGLSGFIRKVRDDFNLTMLLIEHNVPLVMGLCDRIAVLNFGELIALGDPHAVQNDPAVIEAYLGGDE
jgi:branched-chain amino acid transport system ATP-binding protein